MNLNAILLAILIACGLMAVLMVLAMALDLVSASAPQLLILFALWILPGYIAGLRALHAGALHGLLTGLLGMLVIYTGFNGLLTTQLLASFEHLAAKSPLIYVVLAGFWASLGGLLADIVRMIRAKRAIKK
ncbi:MAG: hypothetical protein QNJ78_02290 [Gammaproteobacteria bacterium]|nr:hypothetical protein [Gammaproteobacteria bacterium]